MIKRCPDPKCVFVFLQLVRLLKKLLEKCFRGEVKYTFVYPGELKTDSNNALLLCGCYRQDFERLQCKYNRAP